MSDESADEENYEVEKILDKKKVVDDKDNASFLYLIKWKNFDDSWNTWEPLSCLDNCQEMLEKFEAEYEKKHKKTSAAVYVSENESESDKDDSVLIPYSSGKRLNFDDLSDDDRKKKQLKMVTHKPLDRMTEAEKKKLEKKKLSNQSLSKRKSPGRTKLGGTVVEFAEPTDEDSDDGSYRASSSRKNRKSKRETRQDTNKENEIDEVTEEALHIEESLWDQMIVKSKAALEEFGDIKSILGIKSMGNLKKLIVFAYTTKRKDPLPVAYDVVKNHYPQELIAHFEKVTNIKSDS